MHPHTIKEPDDYKHHNIIISNIKPLRGNFARRLTLSLSIPCILCTQTKKNNEIMHRTIDNQRARQLQAIIISNIKPHMAGTHRRNFARRYTVFHFSSILCTKTKQKKKNKIEDMYNTKK